MAQTFQEAAAAAQRHDMEARGRRPRVTDLSSEMVRVAKGLLVHSLREVEPDYLFEPSAAELYRNVTLWALRCQDGPCKPERGFWLMGNIGTGKSTLMRGLKLMCRAVRPSEDAPCHPAWRIESAGQICRDYQQHGAGGVQQYIDSLSLCIDDLGTENTQTNHYGTSVNVIADILLARYDRRATHLTHVTTNLTPDQLKNLYGPRVFDRVREMFNLVEMPGRSWRECKA